MSKNRKAVRYAQTRFLVPETFTRAIRVLVVGCGGSGSEMVDALARVHCCSTRAGHEGLRITLQDGDTVSEANVGRARFLPADVGANKAALLARRYGLLFGLPITAVEHACTAREIQKFGQFFDLVITCVDKASFRVKVADHWCNRSCETLWLDTGNGDFSGQCVLGSLGRPAGERLPNVLDLFPGIRQTPDNDAPSCSMAEALKSQQLFVNRWVVDSAGAMLWRLLAEGHITNHGALVDMRTLKMTPIAVHSASWEFFGFKVPKAAAAKPESAVTPTLAPA
ncbi:MAG TPA: PRTRC system ThiF family protein [Nevskia sp.]|nr:PRTRC system ThiF family protein [Nevskia sp.]